MCANYEPIRKDRVHLLDLLEPTFDYKADVYLGYDCPLIFSKDGLPFTVAAIYDSTVIDGQQVRSMSMLTINADNHPFMSQFHKPEDEKRSIIVIPEEYRENWLNCKKEDADQFFFEMPVAEFTSNYFPKPNKKPPA